MTTEVLGLAENGTALRPAGGGDPTYFDWRAAWYPVFYERDLDRQRPNRFTLLGEDLVIWWDGLAQAWRVFTDACPHRLAPLSQGRINEAGQLECPYHGWAFDGAGRCQVIPQESEGGVAHQSARACLRAWPAVVRQGLLFVYAGDPEDAAQTAVPTLPVLDEDPSGWVCIETFRDLPYDALTLLENVLDASHVPYTHHRTVGNRANAGPVNLEVLAAGRQGFQGVWAEGPRRGTLGRQDTTFVAPALMWHDLSSKQLGRTLTVVYATPIRRGECRLFARFPFRFASPIPALVLKLTPRWLNHLSQNRILEDDQIFLHHQERYLAQRGGGDAFAKAYYLPLGADRFVIELRRWVQTYHADPFPGDPWPVALADEALMDRYHSHTQHCASCRTALARLQKLRQVCLVVGLGLVAIAPWMAAYRPAAAGIWPVLGGVTGLILLGTWAALGRLIPHFHQGDSIPPRNRLK